MPPLILNMYNNIIKVLAKISILLCLLYILYLQVFQNQTLSFSVFVEQLQAPKNISPWYVLISFLILMPLNWLLELSKWFPKMRKIQPEFSFFSGLGALMAGFAVAMFTPNRVGESTGRAIMVAPENRGYAIFLGCYGALAQWLVLIGGGGMAFLFLEKYCLTCLDTWIIAAIEITILLILAVLLYTYKYLEKVLNFCLKFKCLDKYLLPIKNQLQTEEISNTWLKYLLLMAFLRYVVYFSQYVLVLYFWGLSLSPMQMCVGIGIIYFLQTGVPLPASLGLIARGNIAVFVFSWFMLEGNSLLILSATFSLWLLNLLLPALIGSMVLAYHFFISKKSKTISS